MNEGTAGRSVAVRGIRWVWAMGLGVPILLGLVLVGLALMAVYTDPGYRAPKEINAGSLAAFPASAPKFYEDQRFWLVKLPSGEAIALYDRDPISGCTVPWNPNLEFMGRKGWFHDACSPSLYDLQGACFDGPCEIGLNRLRTEIVDGEIVVYLREAGDHGPLRSDNGEPLTP